LQNKGHELQIFSSSSQGREEQSSYKIQAGIQVLLGLGDDPQPTLDRFNPEVIFSHNLFPNIGSGWLRKFGGKTYSFKHNYRDICASGNLYRNGNVCFLCLKGTTFNGVINKCYKNSALMSLPVSLRNSLKIDLRPELIEPKKFLVLSNRMREFLSHTGVDKSKFEVIPNFITDPYAGKLKQETKNSRWVASGRLTSEKGFSELIDYWPSSYGLDIYGDGPLLDELKYKSENRDEISIQGGVSRGVLTKLLPTYHGAILPSRWFEPGPLSVLEYLAAGLPIISTGVWSEAAGLDISQHIETAGSTKEEISQRLLRMITNIESNLTEISLFQREKYLNQFTPDHWYTRLMEIL
jgi:glycosyltransferase involved in cell wall biosynthesis